MINMWLTLHDWKIQILKAFKMRENQAYIGFMPLYMSLWAPVDIAFPSSVNSGKWDSRLVA